MTNQFYDEIWKLIIEYEDTIQIQNDSLLWRLIFLQTVNKSMEDASENRYTIIFKYDHSIMDGNSSYNSILKLMNYIEKLYLNKQSTLNEKKIHELLPCKEDIFEKSVSQSQYLDNIFVTIPKFFDYKNASKVSYQRPDYLSNNEENNGMVLNHDDTSYITVKELVEISRISKSKLRTTIINREDTAKILSKCKENNTKFNTCFNMLLVLAMKLLYKKY